MDNQDVGNKRHNAAMSAAFSKRARVSTPEKPRQHAEQATPILSPYPPTLLGTPSFGNRTGRGRSRLVDKESTFNDPIHGNITMRGLCLRIIDTKEFQRLRELKQLGTCDFVYPGATHTRFSHSIGVGHFAEKVVQQLQSSQPELQITEIDKLCVKVAGLCHDLGHGPFSHVFDGVFMSRARPEVHWHHESWSVMIFRHLLVQNRISLLEYGLDDTDQLFIEEIILGTKDADRRGREKSKYFLYDVVNNSRSGLDVDKLDYFQRDIRHTNVDAMFSNFSRFVEFGRVMRAEPIRKGGDAAASTPRTSMGGSQNGAFSHLFPTKNISSPQPVGAEDWEYMICYPEKMVYEALQLFALRFTLHKKVYTHKSVKKVEFMLVDALLEADEHIRIPGGRTAARPDGLYKMSECVEDAAALSNLNDSVVYLIETSTQPELQKAQEILRRIRSRDFYPHVGRVVYSRQSRPHRMSEEEIVAGLVRHAAEFQTRMREGKVSISALGTSSAAAALFAHQWDENPDDAEEEADGMQYDQDMEIFSQDSCAPWVRGNNLSRTQSLNQMHSQSHSQSSVAPNWSAVYLDVTLSTNDVIVEKMHIHHGQKDQNPVNNLRFFPKYPISGHTTVTNGLLGGEETVMVARQAKESQYSTLRPVSFEELALRVFCRDKRKAPLLQRAFEDWCQEHAVLPPSEPNHNHA